MCFLAIFASQVACAFLVEKTSAGLAAPTVSPTDSVPRDVIQDEPDNAAEEECVPPSPQIIPSKFIIDVIMAKSVEDESMAPVDETSVFGMSDVFNAVVSIENAPADTRVKAAWYVIDVGDAAACNEFIVEHEVISDGSRYLNFNLKPNGAWPLGTYRVEISVNDVLASVQYFTVR